MRTELREKLVSLLGAGFFVLAVQGAKAQDFDAGLRGGASFDGGSRRFQQGETFADWKLWHWRIDSEWYVRPEVDISAGGLNGQGKSGFVGTLGPIFELHRGNFPLILEAGSSPTLLSRDIYGTRNFGYRFQFTSHLGLELALTKRVTIGWRYQHMSNAGIAKPNPGLNMEVIWASFAF